MLTSAPSHVSEGASTRTSPNPCFTELRFRSCLMAPCVVLRPRDGHERSLVGLWLFLSVSPRYVKALPHSNPEDKYYKTTSVADAATAAPSPLIRTSGIIQAGIASGTITHTPRLSVGTPRRIQSKDRFKMLRVRGDRYNRDVLVRG